ncbi:hypothetical protein FA13DRAFT_593106 [Coprinellus micaceus]|uniref:Uncharacterized protein n=1 Tax=Coprinellus micaceus TaxID=71717 RepID=A0A4Y7SA92_COPMI|nr:hypothetical protein FA13DRAFT_593106 [Coprinellus micaceus]
MDSLHCNSNPLFFALRTTLHSTESSLRLPLVHTPFGFSRCSLVILLIVYMHTACVFLSMLTRTCTQSD